MNCAWLGFYRPSRSGRSDLMPTFQSGAFAARPLRAIARPKSGDHWRAARRGPSVGCNAGPRQAALPEAEKKRQVAHHRALKRNLSERSLQRRNKRGETFVDLLIHAEDMARDDRIRNRPNQFATKRSNPQRPSLCYKMLRNASKCFVLTRSHLCTPGCGFGSRAARRRCVWAAVNALRIILYCLRQFQPIGKLSELSGRHVYSRRV